MADHACGAIAHRLIEAPARLDVVAGWTRQDNLWARRAALVATLPWARMDAPSAEDLARRERILGWARDMIDDPDWFAQKAVAWWVRDLSKRAPMRARRFLEENGARMKAFARREAGRYLAAAGQHEG